MKLKIGIKRTKTKKTLSGECEEVPELKPILNVGSTLHEVG